MKTKRKNVFKVLVLLLVAVFMSQTLCLGAGSISSAEAISLAATNNVMTLSDTEKTTLKDAYELAEWLASGTETNVQLTGGVGTIYNLGEYTYETKENFSGTFDGGYCTILGLTKPLFGTVTDATITNVYIGTGAEASKSEINISTRKDVGAIACKSDGSEFYNCINNAIVNVTYTSTDEADIIRAGGIVGYATGATKINSCSNHASITAGEYDSTGATGVYTSYAGGIVGYADGTTKVENCYVLSSTDNNISIKANAITQIESPTTFRKKNNSLYYNGLTHLVTKVNQDLEKKKQEIAGYQGEASSLQKQIDKQHANIKAANNRIAQLRAEKSRLKWYQVGSKLAKDVQIAAEYVKIAAYGVAIGALEAARAIVYAAITAAQAIMQGMAAVITYSLRDTNWLNVTSDAKKEVKHSDAYAYGIGYFAVLENSKNDTKEISSCYTHKVETVGGFHEATYTYPLRFWSTSEFLRGTYASDPFTDKVIFREENYYGPITNSNNIASDVYYYTPETEKYSENRFIYVEDQNNSGRSTNWYGADRVSTNKHRVHVSVEKQQLIIATTGENKDEIVLMVNNGRDFIDSLVKNYAGLGTKFDSKKFDRVIPIMVGNGNTATTIQEISNIATDELINVDSATWGVTNEINGGYPYLKCRYWQHA